MAAGGVDDVDGGVDGLVGFHVDVEADVGPGGEDVVEAGDDGGSGDSEGAEVFPGQVGDGGGVAGEAVEGGVVEDDGDAVGGGVDVGF